MDVSRFKRLATKEDKFHLHKILGIASLGHYVYRFYNDFNDNISGTSWSVSGWLLVHIMLSSSSLMFHIPQNRVKSSPMIWPEFRMHSILFALRSLFACLIVVHLHDYYVISLLLRQLLVLATLYIADWITDYYKKNDNKLGSTMRGMPMPNYFSPAMKYYLNLFYSFSQVLATLTLIIYRENTYPLGQLFWTVFPIQIAPFLMTLARKGLISSFGWHLGYTLALLWNYIYGIRQTGMFPMTYWVYAITFCVGRFMLNINKYSLWGLVCASNFIIQTSQVYK